MKLDVSSILIKYAADLLFTIMSYLNVAAVAGH